MRVLHVGDDFAALRPCGLTSYSDALMRSQAEIGHDVGYVFSGRQYPRVSGPRLKRWRHGRVRMYELIGSPNHRHWDLGTQTPTLDIDERAGERTFDAAFREVQPDIVHVHELARLPSSIIERAADRGVPVIVTLHDYKLVCSTVRLLRGDGRLCTGREVGEHCARECATAPATDAHLIHHTLDYELGRAKRIAPFAASRDYSGLAPLIGGIKSLLRIGDGGQDLEGDPAPANGAPAADYQRRRDVNVARLNRCQALVAPSARVAEIHADLGVDTDRLVVQRLSLPHLERLHPRRGSEVSTPLTFLTLGGGASPSKGSRALLAAVRKLNEAGRERDYRLVVCGYVENEIAEKLRATASVELLGSYEPGQLDELLDRGDVGILPSRWEEAHGFVGIEMLAKGLPVIGSALGGITEYVRDGETGWLDRSEDGSGLAELMAAAMDNPSEVERLRVSVREHRGDLVRPFAEHAAEVEALYAEVAAATAASQSSAIR